MKVAIQVLARNHGHGCLVDVQRLIRSGIEKPLVNLLQHGVGVATHGGEEILQLPFLRCDIDTQNRCIAVVTLARDISLAGWRIQEG
ncbi:MAG: hypothetical protein JJT87_01630 [Halomonas sp.]|nr:hypothetical protein [Halomonas sp.]MCC5900613.1 hypothetical protein [Halomonas sp.]